MRKIEVSDREPKTARAWCVTLDVKRETWLKFMQGVKPIGKRASFDTFAYDDVMEAIKRYNGESLESTVDKADLEIRKLAAQCAKLEFQLEVEKGKFIPISQISSRLIELGTVQKAMLRQKLENEFPVACAGQEAAVIRIMGKRLVDDICERMQKVCEEYNEATEQSV